MIGRRSTILGILATPFLVRQGLCMPVKVVLEKSTLYTGYGPDPDLTTSVLRIMDEARFMTNFIATQQNHIYREHLYGDNGIMCGPLDPHGLSALMDPNYHVSDDE